MIIRVSTLFHAWKSFLYVRIKHAPRSVQKEGLHQFQVSVFRTVRTEHARGVCTERGGPPNNPRNFFRETKRPLLHLCLKFPAKNKKGSEYSSEPSGCPFFGQSKQINEISWQKRWGIAMPKFPF